MHLISRTWLLLTLSVVIESGCIKGAVLSVKNFVLHMTIYTITLKTAQPGYSGCKNIRIFYGSGFAIVPSALETQR